MSSIARPRSACQAHHLPAPPIPPTAQSPNGQGMAREPLLRQLVAHSTLVGGVFSMNFDEALVITNDLWKRQAGGLPRHSFLLATAGSPGAGGDDEDEEVILLRAVGPAPLPADP